MERKVERNVQIRRYKRKKALRSSKEGEKNIYRWKRMNRTKVSQIQRET
jgi:hypothetical protein